MFVSCLVGILALALLQGSDAWTYVGSSSFGPSFWAAYFPDCNSTVQQQSPTPLVPPAGPVQYTLSAARMIPATLRTVTFTTMQNSGGLLIARPLSDFPMRFRQVGGFAPSDRTMYLREIAYHIGLEHRRYYSGTITPVMEVQYFLSENSGELPTVGVAQLVTSTPTPISAFVDTSVGYKVLTSVSAYTSTMNSGGSVNNDIDTSVAHVFLGATLNATSAVVYRGTMPYPPCANVRMVVCTTPVSLPQQMIQFLQIASSNRATTRPMQETTGSFVAFTKINFREGPPTDGNGVEVPTPAPVILAPQRVARVVANPVNTAMMQAIIALVATNVGLLLYIGLLLLARWEVIEWPTWLGGLGRSVEWWTNPKSAGCEDDDDEAEEEEEVEECDEKSITMDTSGQQV